MELRLSHGPNAYMLLLAIMATMKSLMHIIGSLMLELKGQGQFAINKCRMCAIPFDKTRMLNTGWPVYLWVGDADLDRQIVNMQAEVRPHLFKIHPWGHYICTKMLISILAFLLGSIITSSPGHGLLSYTSNHSHFAFHASESPDVACPISKTNRIRIHPFQQPSSILVCRQCMASI